MTITYDFEIFDAKGKAQKLVVEPIVIKSLSKDNKIVGLGQYVGTILVGSAPSNAQLASSVNKTQISTPFKMSITLAETTEGKGVKLAGKIAYQPSEN